MNFYLFLEIDSTLLLGLAAAAAAAVYLLYQAIIANGRRKRSLLPSFVELIGFMDLGKVRVTTYSFFTFIVAYLALAIAGLLCLLHNRTLLVVRVVIWKLKQNLTKWSSSGLHYEQHR